MRAGHHVHGQVAVAGDQQVARIDRREGVRHAGVVRAQALHNCRPRRHKHRRGLCRWCLVGAVRLAGLAGSVQYLRRRLPHSYGRVPLRPWIGRAAALLVPVVKRLRAGSVLQLRIGARARARARCEEHAERRGVAAPLPAEVESDAVMPVHSFVRAVDVIQLLQSVRLRVIRQGVHAQDVRQSPRHRVGRGLQLGRARLRPAHGMASMVRLLHCSSLPTIWVFTFVLGVVPVGGRRGRRAEGQEGIELLEKRAEALVVFLC
mmetsp:Transcript_14542/g.54934  ORF Transcript_14542/g.54934 Transcript_14542/m.54934 type:complete len:262 (-) Transcript_14542:170-955(-)